MKAPGDRTLDRLIGQRLKVARMARRVSQEEMGNAIGVTFQQVQKYEKGNNRISASRLLQCAVILKMPFEYFMVDALAYCTDGEQPPTCRSVTYNAEIERLRLHLNQTEDLEFIKAMSRLVERHNILVSSDQPEERR